MSKNVIWTQDERTALAAATLNLLSNAAQMPVTAMNSADVQKQAQRYGFFSGVFRQAQLYVFANTPERVRTIITHTQVPWLMEEIYSRMREVHVADMIAAQEKERSEAQAAAAKEKSVLEAVSLTKSAGHNYRAVHGGVTSIKKALNDLYAKINNPAAQKAATV